MTRALNVLAWVGTGLVFAAAAVRILGWADAIRCRPTWTGTRCTRRGPAWRSCSSTRSASGAQIVAWFGHRNARYGTLASVSVLVGLGILVAVNYLSDAAEQAVGPDREPAVHAVGPDGEAAAGADGAGEVRGLRPQHGLRSLPDAADQLRVQLEAGHDRVHRSRPASGAGQGVRDPAVRHGGGRVHGPQGTRDDRRRAGPHQRADQGAEPVQEEGLLPRRPRREGHRPSATARATAPSPTRSSATTTSSTSWCWRRPTRFRPTPPCSSIAGPRTDLLEQEVPLLARLPRPSRGSSWCCWIRRRT